jgi:protein SCO1/2
MTLHRRTWLTAATAALATATLFTLTACDKAGTSAAKPAAKFHGVDITGAEYARTLALTDQDGKPRSLADFKGKVTVVFFGYTQCPDVCPTTMAELAQVKKSLGPDGDRVQGIFVTIDPERDKPELLKAYMSSFDPTFVGLSGSLAEVSAVAKEFKVFFAKVQGKSDTSYTMDHTAGSFVFDPEGKVRLFVRYGSGAQPLADDLKLLLGGA